MSTSGRRSVPDGRHAGRKTSQKSPPRLLYGVAVAVLVVLAAGTVVVIKHLGTRASGQSSANSAGSDFGTSQSALPSWAIGPFTRHSGNPVLAPPVAPTSANAWEWPEVFNPGVVIVNGIFHMLYRGDDFAGISSIGAATSASGYQFTAVSRQPVITPTLPSEVDGVEDPRLYYLAGKYYTFFTGDFGSNADINEAVSSNGQDWTQLGPVLRGTKDAAVVSDPEGTPVLIAGHYVMYYGQMGAAYLAESSDFVHWTTVGSVNMGLPASYEPWELCVAVTDYRTTANGSLNTGIDLFVAGGLMGHGRWYYAISEAQVARANLLSVAAHLTSPVLYPQAAYEIYGHTPRTVFMNNIIFHDNEWWMYYGGGDSVVALANAPLR
jgi:predicted GH43/DUF377 family glycosyl hydrolase